MKLMIFIEAEGRTCMCVYNMSERCVCTSQCARGGTELNGTSPSRAAGTAQEVGCLFALVHI